MPDLEDGVGTLPWIFHLLHVCGGLKIGIYMAFVESSLEGLASRLISVFLSPAARQRGIL
jgi:hypothetical protein